MTGIPIPPPTEPLVDEKGQIRDVWYRYLAPTADDEPRLGQVSYMYRQFSFDSLPTTALAPATFNLGTVPANAAPLETFVRINSTFNGSNVIVGTSANASAVVSTNDIFSGTTGFYIVDRYVGTRSTVDVAIYVQTVSSGASAGQADIWMAYLPTT